MNARAIQLVALVVLVICTVVSGAMLGPITRQTERSGLRYTDVSVEGAPPFVALGTAIGALRGLIVDILWIKVNYMKERGLFYEVMADAELITKLQPRFAAVWAFHGHNMAYNISVATQTMEERWEWVNAGIRLVRGDGLRHNPNNLVLHKELAFWFAHKIEGYADDAHLFYKRQFCEEWHDVLGPPPEEQAARVAWIRAIADAPDTLAEAERETPGVRALIDRLNESVTPFGDSLRFEPNIQFLRQYGVWRSVKEQSAAAEVLGLEKQFATESPFFKAFDEIAGDPDATEAWDVLVRYVRRRVLIDDYNMDPVLMADLTEDLGPVDWRHGQAHALYWSTRGSMYGEPRTARQNDIYNIVNNDRLRLQAMQDLARYGRITFDPFSSELPSRFSEPRWIPAIEKLFIELYQKHYGTRGAGGDTFIAFLENFMSSAICEAFRSGEFERAEELMAMLDEKFGTGAQVPNRKYQIPLDVFVVNQSKGEYIFQPHLAPRDTVASLRYGFREGVGRDREEVYENTVEFVEQLIAYFKGNEYNDYVSRFGEARMGALLADLEKTRVRAFLQLMTDPTISLNERSTIWGKVDKFEPTLRLEVYDQIGPSLARQFAQHELSQKYAFAEIFPEPPGMDIYRRQRALQRQAEEQATDQKPRDTLERK
ncbi:MAG: hypothetical protein GY715_04225 [Planctomycetes bacterium]|nr:hypothetical protein [Planctomycetota bacterium]